MPDAHLTHPDLDPLARTVLDDYLAALAALLPGPSRHTAGIIDEIDDGLLEATAAFRRQGLAPREAAHAAVAEFGDPHIVSAAIRPELAGETARRIAVALAVTGPVLGLCWIANAWANALPPWQHHLTGPWLGLPLLGLAVLIAMPALLVTLAGTGRLSRWMSLPPGSPLTTAATAAIAAAIADVTLLTMFTTHALTGSGDLHWVPVALAVMASLARMTFAARAARHCLGSKAALA